MMRYAIVLLLLFPLLPYQPDTVDIEEPCNGEVALCDRLYTEVTFAETHNAHSTLDAGFLIYAANHRANMMNQYDAGIRAFMIDAHHADPELLGEADTALCHGSSATPFHPCAYGSVNAVELLSNLHAKMNETPRDVVTLLFEVAVPYSHLEYILAESGLLPLVHVQPLGMPWPTLGEMVDSERRLVVFIEGRADAEFPFLHDFSTHGWTTNYAEESVEEMNCAYHRGDPSQPVWHLNNWLADEIGLSDWTKAPQANAYDFLLDRAIECWRVQDHRPTFIAVDWWTEGEVVNVTRTLNAMEHWSHSPPERATTD